MCYCSDCQLFAAYLGRADELLDKAGGTEVVGLRPSNIVFTRGNENLICMSITEKGLLRWYSSCCNTPIGNTPRNFKIAHIGLIHSCIDGAPISLEGAFGSLNLRVNTDSAKQKPTPSKGVAKLVVRHVASLVRERLSGCYRQTPLFDGNTGEPVSQPVVLDDEQRQRLSDVV